MPKVDSLMSPLVAYAEELTRAINDGRHRVISISREKWRRDADGVFRPHEEPRPIILPHLDGAPSPLLEAARKAISEDESFGPYIGGLVGNSLSSSLFDSDVVISRIVHDALINNATAGVDLADKIDSNLRELRDYFEADEHAGLLLVPIPGLKAANFPIEIEPGFEIDSFSESEVEACAESGLLQPMHHGYRLFGEAECVGVRIQIPIPVARTRPGDQTPGLPKPEVLNAKHQFGVRSLWKWNEFVEDVLFTMRLCLSGQVLTRGGVLVSDGHMGRSMNWGSRAVPTITLHSSAEIDAETELKIRETWAELCRQGKTPRTIPSICMRRFNTAIERTNLEDSIIDHLIAAEALFLNEIGSPEHRGELGFRLSLRAAVMLERSGRSRREYFKFWKKAYDLRSTIAHGGGAPEIVKVGTQAYPIGEFVAELGRMMRDALGLAINECAQISDFGSTDYWDRLVLGGPEVSGA